MDKVEKRLVIALAGFIIAMLVYCIILFMRILTTNNNVDLRANYNQNILKTTVTYSKNLEEIELLEFKPKTYKEESFLIFYQLYSTSEAIIKEDIKTVVKQVDSSGKVLQEYLINSSVSDSNFNKNKFRDFIEVLPNSELKKFGNPSSILRYDFIKNKFEYFVYEDSPTNYKITPISGNFDRSLVLYEVKTFDNSYDIYILDIVSGEKYFIENLHTPASSAYSENLSLGLIGDDTVFYTSPLGDVYKIDLKLGEVESVVITNDINKQQILHIWNNYNDKLLVSTNEFDIALVDENGVYENILTDQNRAVFNMVFVSPTKAIVTITSKDYLSMSQLKVIDFEKSTYEYYDDIKYDINTFYNAVYCDEKYVYVLRNGYKKGKSYILLDKETLAVVKEVPVETDDITNDALSYPLIVRVKGE